MNNNYVLFHLCKFVSSFQVFQVSFQDLFLNPNLVFLEQDFVNSKLTQVKNY